MDTRFTELRLRSERVLNPQGVALRREYLVRQRPVILMGRGKSGTRLLAWACTKLNIELGTSETLATGDIDYRPLREVLRALARRNLDVRTMEQLRTAELNLFQKSAYEASRWLRGRTGRDRGWGWKWPETYLITPYVYKTFPQGRYIHMVRDGRDIAFKHHSTDDATRKLGRTILRYLDVHNEPRHLQNAASWEFQVKGYREFAAEIPAAQRFDMTYEEFCRDPMQLMERIAEFLEVPMTDACRDYIRTTTTSAQISQYQDADQEQIAEVEARIGPTLTALGYPLSTDSKSGA